MSGLITAAHGASPHIFRIVRRFDVMASRLIVRTPPYLVAGHAGPDVRAFMVGLIRLRFVLR
ncbi:hypothetical protein [Acetobacter oeni]|uniref:hypothetical protein n=1 Tax=Acetobacter oeni TaxID=304077 RepID=UPI0011BF3233|nr:hypothetical protein [Acetobacter oeni]MBB3884400.1 hypothetical protein [Acetobacter oeni]NHO20378.1 hypothetical protein [Acetobacter oeni]